jgi:hypothetical protein
MRELQSPTLTRVGFEDSHDIAGALAELTDISDMRSRAHEAANLFRDFHITPGSTRERQLRGELASARGVLARWAVMAAHHEFRTVDLARVKNNGDWEATMVAEVGIDDIAMELFENGRIDGVIHRDSPEAGRRITIDPGLLSGRGLMAVRHKRLILATTPVYNEFVDVRPGKNSKERIGADTSITIDQVSEFVLDLGRLREASEQAADEVRQVTSGGIRAMEITQADGIVAAPAVIEAAIRDHSNLVTPTVTTYYADRKYQNLQKLDAQT